MKRRSAVLLKWEALEVGQRSHGRVVAKAPYIIQSYGPRLFRPLPNCTVYCSNGIEARAVNTARATQHNTILLCL